VTEVDFDSDLAYEEFVSDLFVRTPFSYEPKHLALTSGKALVGRGLGLARTFQVDTVARSQLFITSGSQYGPERKRELRLRRDKLEKLRVSAVCPDALIPAPAFIGEPYGLSEKENRISRIRSGGGFRSAPARIPGARSRSDLRGSRAYANRLCVFPREYRARRHARCARDRVAAGAPITLLEESSRRALA